MSIMEWLSASPWVARVGWMLVHFVWQGAAVGLALALTLALLQRHAAAARYAACLGALVFMALLPPVTLAVLSADLDVAARVVGEGVHGADAPDTPAVAQAAHEREVSSLSNGAAGAIAGGGTIRPAWMPWLVFAWLVGVCTLSLRLLGGWVQVEVLRRRLVDPVEDAIVATAKRLCAQLDIKRPVRVLRSALAQTPMTLGWLRPVVLLPVSVLTGLTPPQLEAILAHELAHVCRNDFLANLFQTVMETLFFYHPVVWWASGRMRAEREFCCDDLAAAAVGDQLDYARALAQLEALRHGAVPDLVAAASGGMLLSRIRRIIQPAHFQTPRTEWFWGGLTAAVIVVLVGSTLRMTSVTAAQQGTADARNVESSASPAPLPGNRADAVEDTAVAPVQEGGVVLLDFERIGSLERIGDAPAQLHALVSAALAETSGVRLVDRAVLDAALAEQRLARAGLSDAATAAKIGRLVGARTLVDGKLMQLDPGWVFTARLVDVETLEVAGVRVTGQIEDGLLDLSEAVGAVLARRLGEISRSVGDPVSEDAFAPRIASLREKLQGRSLPRITVRVPETHIGTLVPDPAGENELVRVLRGAGFTVVDVDTFMEREQASWWANLFFGPAEDGEGRAGGLRQGWRDPAVILHNERLARLRDKADVFIVGEAFSEFVGEQYGFQSCQARIEVKALATASEAVAAAGSQHATAADLGEFIAGKKALRLAGGELALALAEELADYWDAQGDAAVVREAAR